MNYKLNFSDIKENAFGDWLNILTRCGLDVTPKGKAWHVSCPICNDDNCFRVDDSTLNRTYLCKCSSGDGFMLLQQALGITSYQAFSMVNDVMNGDSYKPSNKTVTHEGGNKTVTHNNGDKLARVLKYSKRTPTRDALAYYKLRGITCMNQRHDFVSYGYQWYMGRKLVANNKPTKHHVILPKISFFGCDPVGVVRIYTSQSTIQALIPNEKVAKKPVLKGAVSSISGAGIWFTNDPMKHLHVAEGYENGLSVAVDQKTMDVVCGNTAAGLAALIIPNFVKSFTIWMDSGDKGMNAARTLYKRYAKTKKIEWRIPPRGKDWNDLLISGGSLCNS